MGSVYPAYTSRLSVTTLTARPAGVFSMRKLSLVHRVSELYNSERREQPESKNIMIRALSIFCMALLSHLAHADDRWMSIPQPPHMPQSENSGLAKVNGINMYFATYGTATGTPILMIHGGLAHGVGQLCDRTAWITTRLSVLSSAIPDHSR
jgi:hypothetical protein